jgi:hypothetical protein
LKEIVDGLPWDAIHGGKAGVGLPAWAKGMSCIVCIPETIIQQRIVDPAAQTELVAGLLDQGLRPLDKEALKRAQEDQELVESFNGTLSPERREAIRKRYGAQLLVVGEALADVQGRTDGMFPARGRVEVRVIFLPSGEIVASAAVQTTAKDISGPLAGKQALQNGGELVCGKLMASWKQVKPAGLGGSEPPQGFRLDVRMTGVLSLSEANHLAKVIGAIPGVEGVNVDAYRAGTLNLTVRTRKSEATLGAELEENARVQAVVSPRRLSVEVAADGKIELVIKKGVRVARR